MSDCLITAGGKNVAPGFEAQMKLTCLYGTAHDGNTQDMSAFLSSRLTLALEQDSYGWTALKIAVRSGNLDCAILLVEKGADVNHRPNVGEGPSILFLAEQLYGKDHPFSAFLVASGGLSQSPTFEF